jgi:hypothetical protein
MSLSKPIDKNYVDVLDEDKPIANQKFVCLSFLSPEKVIKDKKLFFFEAFLKTWDYTKSVELYNNFITFVSYKYSLNAQELQNDLKEFIEQEQTKLTSDNILNDYKNFFENNEEQLQNKFDIENKFQTNVRGLKVRGSYNTQEEAEMRAKILRENDQSHDVFVGQVGLWMPYDPDAYKTGKVEYMESELNELMHAKNKNEEEAKEEFDKRIKETKEKAMKENQELAQKSGNVLSQTLNEKGELVNLSKVDYDSIPDDQVVMEPSNNIIQEFMKQKNVTNDNGNEE